MFAVQVVALNPGNWLAWIIVGLVAGGLAGIIVRGRGYGCVVNVVVGILGAFIGAFFVGLLIPHPESYGFWESMLIALGGSIVLLGFVQMVSHR